MTPEKTKNDNETNEKKDTPKTQTVLESRPSVVPKEDTTKEREHSNPSKSSTEPLSTLEECQREIARLSKLLASLQVKQEPIVLEESALITNVEAFKIHAQVQEAETNTYNVLKNIASRMGPQLSITPIKIEKPSPFTSPLKITILNQIPSLFKIKTISGNVEDTDAVISNSDSIQPKYLQASRQAFKFGITEASFVMESDGLPNEIKFLPGNSSSMFKDVRGNGTGPVNLEASRTDYVFLIFETLFKLYLNSQFILSDVEFKTQFDRDTFAGDLISVKGMLKNQFIDQEVPLLPAAGYGHSARYLLENLRQMFNEPHHGMQLGELARDSISQRKVFRRAGVITDQYTARLNEIYLDYLFARSIDHTSYIVQHRALTLPNVSIKVDKPSVFANSLIPIWKRNECDGCLLVYALDVKRQQKYLTHLTELLASVNLLTFASVDEVAQLPPRRSLRDAEIQQLLDTALTSVNENEVFRALALDLSTTWVDTNITIRGFSTTPLDAVFKVFTTVLWFCYFPSIARDNVPKLMFELFSAMEELATDETSRFVRHAGFSNYNGRNASIQEYPKELYLNGTITYPLLLQAPPNRFRLFRQLHDLLVANHGEVQNTNDNASISTPRMSDVRQYYQPYHSLSAVSNALAHGENPNDFGNRLKDLHHFMKQLIEEYKRKYRDYTNRSAFGNSTSSVSQLLGYFDAYNPALLYSIGIRGHAELFALRQLGANSPYVVDCQNFLAADQRLRPQVLFELDNGDWSAIMMQRHQDELSFELPLFMFLTLRGAYSLESIMPPDATVQFQNLLRIQEEGILCGDVIKFVNNIKFGDVGLFNREALGISTVVTAARSDRIFIKLSEVASLSDFKDLFSVLINDVSQRIDSRAISFRIVLQPYLSSLYNDRIPQPAHSQYGVNLNLGREFMDDVMTIASPLFVPETSPISLYTTGLAIKYTIKNDLDPFEYIDVREAAHQAERIVMYSPDLLTRRVRDGMRFIDEDVIQLPSPDGELEIYQLGDNMPFTIIIVNTVTGPISNIDYHKLVRFLKERKIMFYFPELMVIMDRALMEQHVFEEALLEPQLIDVLTGLPARRVTLVFGDTVSKPYRLANSPQKFKFLYPINAINQRQIVLKGMSDPIQAPPELQIGTWMSWAYGGTNGKTVIVRNGELYRDGEGNDVLNDANEEQVIDKLDLGFVNMNNEMRILTMPEYLATPQIEQDTKRAYVGIYTVS
uniref:VP2 n=1 Tax=Shelly beach virus TaxID=2485878 RepID=A0A3G3BTR2_9VIRU|nr:VP2 [Shelly beach virus]